MNNNIINIIGVLASNLKIIKIESTPTRTRSSCGGVFEFSFKFLSKKGSSRPHSTTFLHGPPTKYPKSLSLRFGVHQTSSKKVTETIFFIFSSLWWPLMTSEVFKL